MKDLVQVAVSKDINNQHAWPSLAQFNTGGILETAEILSMQDFLRAEDNLERTPDNIETDTIHHHNAEILHLFRADHGKAHKTHTHTELFNAHLTQVNRLEDANDKTIYNYSLKETTREHNGGVSDADVTTAGGYLKKGILAPEANTINDRKRRDTARFMYMIRDQEQITQMLKELSEQIEALNNEIAAHDEAIAEMEEMLDVLDDGSVSANTPASRARRAKLESWAKEKGVDLDKFKKEDGSIDQDKLRDHIAREQQETIDRRDAALEELEERQEEYRIAENRLEEITQVKRTELADAEASGDVQNIEQAKIALRDSSSKGLSEYNQSLSDDERLETLAAEAGVDSSDVTISDFGLGGGMDLDYLFANLVILEKDVTIAPAKLSGGNVTYGSFSGNDLNDNAANDTNFNNMGNIENIFNAKSNPELIAQQDPSAQQPEEKYTYSNISNKSTYVI